MFVCVKTSKGFKYLVIARSFRQNGKSKQQIVANLGRLDLLHTYGKYDDLLLSLARFSKRLKIIDTANKLADTEAD